MHVEDCLTIAESLTEDQIFRFGIIFVRPETVLVRRVPFVQNDPIQK